MCASLRALLSGAIDYAGLFPPAALPLVPAVGNYRRYRNSPEAWLLGRFLCPAKLLPELAATFQPEMDGRLAVIVAPGESAEAFRSHLGPTFAAVGQFPAFEAIDTLEIRLPPDLVRAADHAAVANLAQFVAGKVQEFLRGPATLYYEFAPGNPPAERDAWQAMLEATAGAIAEYNRTVGPDGCRAGLKFRTGGLAAAAVPPSWQLAAVVHACRAVGISWKATAGLHHPLPGHDPSIEARTHGFLNLLAAAVLDEVHSLSPAEVEAMLAEDGPSQFHFRGDTLVWRELSVTTKQIDAARQRSLRSFGSCSFEEPLSDLRALGLM